MRNLDKFYENLINQKQKDETVIVEDDEVDDEPALLVFDSLEGNVDQYRILDRIRLWLDFGIRYERPTIVSNDRHKEFAEEKIEEVDRKIEISF